jgi:cytochrome c553
MQLRAFKSGERKNDHNQVMRNVAKGMTEEDIDAVSAFIQEMKF